jgi:hypothetical protein
MASKWTFPKWMAKYMNLIHGVTTSQDIEDFMNDHTTVVAVNAPRAMMCVSIKCQVGMLERLHKEGKIS